MTRWLQGKKGKRRNEINRTSVLAIKYDCGGSRLKGGSSCLQNQPPVVCVLRGKIFIQGLNNFSLVVKWFAYVLVPTTHHFRGPRRASRWFWGSESSSNNARHSLLGEEWQREPASFDLVGADVGMSWDEEQPSLGRNSQHGRLGEASIGLQA